MKLRVGTSGFSFKAWKGHFYPEKLPQTEYLRYYAERFDTVEVNNTFYRMPRTEMLEGWREKVGPDFRFVLKASMRITHRGRLKNADESVQYLFDKADALGDKLGPVFFQLPPNMKVDLERLRTFLGVVPKGRPIAFEFRHDSWFDEAVYDVLREFGVALCAADTDEKDAPLVHTCDWAYVRLRRDTYDEDALRGWHEKLRALDLREAWVYFKHEDEGKGPRMARTFLELRDT